MVKMKTKNISVGKLYALLPLYGLHILTIRKEIKLSEIDRFRAKTQQILVAVNTTLLLEYNSSEKFMGLP